MPLVSLEIARNHCRADVGDDGVLAVYLAAAEQAASDYLNRLIYEDQEALDAAEDPAGMVVNGVVIAAILLICGHLYANREDVVTGVSVAQLPNGARDLLRPHRLIPGL